MSNPCYYHPDILARSSCVQCGMPICDSCTDRINEKTVCHRCVQTVRQRLEKQMAASPVGAVATGPTPSGYAPGGYNSQPAGAWPPPPVAQPYGGGSAAVAEPLDMSRVIIGIVVAMLIGIVGAIAVEKIYFYAGFGL